MIYEATSLECGKVKLPTNINHINFKWVGDGVVYFSATKKGDALSIHLAATRKNRKHLRVAVEEFCQTMFANGINKIIGQVGSLSVRNLALNCGFKETLRRKAMKDDKILTLYFVERCKP